MSLLSELQSLNQEWQQEQVSSVISKLREAMLNNAKSGLTCIVISGDYTIGDNDNDLKWRLKIDNVKMGNYSKTQAVQIFKALYKFTSSESLSVYLRTDDRYILDMSFDELTDILTDADGSGCDELGEILVSWGKPEEYGDVEYINKIHEYLKL